MALPTANVGERGRVVTERDVLVQGYSNHLLHIVRLAPSTTLQYVGRVQRFLKWWNRPVELFTDVEWDDWEISLSKSGIDAATIRNTRGAVKRFYKYLRRIRLLGHDPAVNMERIKTPKRLPTWLLESEVDLIVSRADSVRSRAILEVLYSCGLRNEECSNLKLDNLQGKLLQVTGKGRKERIVPIPGRARAALDAWLLERPADTDLVFPSSHRQAMVCGTLINLVRKHVKLAGIKKDVTPHSLRHSIATHLRMRGVSMDEIQLFLGHESPVSTMIYVHLANSLMHSAIVAAHPHGS